MTRKRPVPPGVQVERVSTLSLQVTVTSLSTAERSFIAVSQTFLESYDFSGKKIILFATSGGSGFGNTVKELKDSAPGAEIVEGKLLNRSSEIADWAASL